MDWHGERMGATLTSGVDTERARLRFETASRRSTEISTTSTSWICGAPTRRGPSPTCRRVTSSWSSILGSGGSASEPQSRNFSTRRCSRCVHFFPYPISSVYVIRPNQTSLYKAAGPPNFVLSVTLGSFAPSVKRSLTFSIFLCCVCFIAMFDFVLYYCHPTGVHRGGW